MGRSKVRFAAGQDIDFRYLARKIGAKLREVYGRPEAEQIPTEQVQLLLALRHKERDAARRS